MSRKKTTPGATASRSRCPGSSYRIDRGERGSNLALLAGQPRQDGGFLNRLAETSHVGDAALAVDHGGAGDGADAISLESRPEPSFFLLGPVNGQRIDEPALAGELGKLR